MEEDEIRFMEKVAIVGMGKRGGSALPIFIQKGVEVIWVADKDKDADGIKIAKEKKIPVFYDYKEAISAYKPDLLINFTDDPEVSSYAKEILGKDRVLGGDVARLLWYLSTEAQKRLDSLKKEHQILIERESYLKNILEFSPAGVIVTDIFGNIEDINSFGQNLLGITKDKVIGKNIKEFVEGDLKFPDIKESGSSVVGEKYALRGKGEEPTFVLISSAFIYTEEKEPKALVWVLKDVTEHEKMKEEIERRKEEFETLSRNLDKLVRERTRELQEINEKLSELNEAKIRFMGKVSHELKTPLTGILGFSELLLNERVGKLNESQKRYVKNIVKSGEHLRSIIDDLLDFSRIDSGKVSLFFETFSVKDVVEEAVSLMMPLCEQKGLLISYSCEKDLYMEADRKRILQVILNLLSNAIKFTEKGNITVFASHLNDKVRISVKDTGCGISDEEKERIFLEFERGGEHKEKGIGLGLTIAKMIVEMHGGTIGVESEEGKGSEFFFIIPKRRYEYKEEFRVEPRAVKLPGPLVLLAMKREEETSQKFVAHLTNFGYRVILGEEFSEIIEKAKRYFPFVIVLDVESFLPYSMDILYELKNDIATRDIPVIVVSSGRDIERTMAFGALDYIIKPFKEEELIKSLEQLSFSYKVSKLPQRILIVDDDPQILEFLSSVLSARGFGVFKAKNGKEAIMLAEEAIPDLIILDLIMPEMDGFQVMDVLKRSEKTKDIPIIVLTAKELTDQERGFLERKAEAVVGKGGDIFSFLLEEIRRLELLYPKKAGLVDNLTGLFNSRYLDIRFPQELNRAKRYRKPFSMVYIDIAHFREFNRKFGYKKGDMVLREISNILSSQLRLSDVKIKMEKDDFLILLPEVGLSTPKIVAEKIKNVVEHYPFGVDERLRLNISFCMIPKDGEDLFELLSLLKKEIS